MKNSKNLEMFTLALGIALLPPLWAVLSPYIGIKVGPVALICAGIFVASGNNINYAFKICTGYLAGLLWGIITLQSIIILPINKELAQFITLFILGGLAVIMSNTLLSRIVYLPSWLCGWAITLQVMGELSKNDWLSMTIQLAVAMIVGVLYIGIGVLKFQQHLSNIYKKNYNKSI